ncbi:DUF6443 domain-containing protein [Thermoflexibacter ruber]|uniref:DUF6443 domain-containing protein n=1 Tax=Thermoflexibacter ruber TaxID=1003 RepID=A0A1I2JWS6_9BACT|nr:DUF6443 domain-containing protein [Thermoflexibacter ruber]SFF57507.1 hypothetical protein SAMN04488541_10637 [Thermoflexibacter ruber]
MKQYLIFPIYIFLLLFLLLNGKQGYGQCPAPPFCTQPPAKPTINIVGGTIIETRNVKVISESGKRIIDGINRILNGTTTTNNSDLSVVLIPPSESANFSGLSRIPTGVAINRAAHNAGNASYLRIVWTTKSPYGVGNYNYCCNYDEEGTVFPVYQPCWDYEDTNYLPESIGNIGTNAMYRLWYPVGIQLKDVVSISYDNAFVEPTTGVNCTGCLSESCSTFNNAPPCCGNNYCYDNISTDIPLVFNMINGSKITASFRSASQHKERNYLRWKNEGTIKKVALNSSQNISLAVNSPIGGYTYRWAKPDGTTFVGTSINVTQAGHYSVTAISGTNCQTTSTEIIEVVQQFDILPIAITHVDCKNACASADVPNSLGSIHLSVSPYSGGQTYTFAWSRNGQPLSSDKVSSTTSTSVASNLTEGTYTVVITDQQSGAARTATYNIGKRVSWHFLGNNPPNRSFSDGDWIEKIFTEAPNSGNIHFGWSKTATTDNSTNIAGLNFAFAMQGTTLRIVESGTIINVPNMPTLQMNDVLRIKRENNQVKYYYNGNLLYTSSTILNAEEQLFLTRASTNISNNVVDNIGVSFCPACTDEQYNFIRTQVFQVPVKEGDDLSCMAVGEVLTTTQYFDGLGRPIQSVAHEASPSKKDIIQPIEYDAFGRQVRNYLPYTETAQDICARYRTDALTKQADFYSGAVAGVPADTKPYSVTDFEASPLNRALRQFGVGNAWQAQEGTPWNIANTPASADKSVKTRQRATGGGFTRKFVYDKATQTWSGTDTYAKGELLLTEVWDEDNKMVEEHKDLEGRLILKKGKLGTEDVNTYYLYDDLGRLVCVIQPEGFKALASPGPNQYKFTDIEAATQINADIRDRFMFQYRYDARNRLIRKFVPGAEPSTSADWKGWTFMVYDKRDRVILTQEPTQRISLTNGKWINTKYDALNRPVLVTELTNYTNKTQNSLQNDANQSVLSLFEIKQNNDTDDRFYTRNLSYPQITSGNTLSINYYDSYDIDANNNFTNDIDVNLDGTLNDIPYPVSPNDLIDPANSPYSKQVVNANTLYVNRGKLVMTKQRKMLTNATTGAVIFASSTNNPPSYIITVNFYDKYGRLIQSHADNIRASNTTRNKEISTIRYDFTGKALETRLRHRATGSAATAQTAIVNKQMEYDHAGRLKRLYNQIDGQAKVLMAQNEYNEIGQLVKKNIHSLDEGSAFMQNVTYDYNIRGWLTFINKNPATNNISIATNAQSLFRMELRYLNNYNGNISTMLWRGNKAPEAGNPYNGNLVRQYAFTYDGLNRLTRANYTVGAGGLAGENYSVNNGTAANGISYDYNGNILNLQQNGPTTFDANQVPTAFGVIDNLTYAYSGNRLMRVTDAGDNTANTPATQRGDFKDGTNTGDDYAYDHSGNLIADLNKGISLITYNHLNLPMLIKKDANNYIYYVYDGSGAKLRKTVVEAGVTTTTDYIGSFVYTKVGAAPEDYFMATEEGRIVSPLSIGGGAGGGAVFGSPETYEYTYKDHLGNARLAYRQTPITPTAPITLTYEASPGQTTEEQNFPASWAVKVQGEGYRSSNSGKLPTGTITQAGSKKITASAGQSLRVSVRATYNTDPVQVQYMIAQAGGTIEDQDKREKPVLPPNRLTLNSPIVVIPAQAQTNIGEVIIPPSPPRINLIGIGQILGKTLSLQRKAKDDPATPYQGDLGQMNVLGMQSTPPASTAKLVLEVYNGNSIIGTQEQYVTGAGLTSWEELSIGMTLPANTTSIVAYMKYEGGTEVYFDDLKIELSAVPVAMVVQENHYYPFGLGMKGLDYVQTPAKESKFQFNGVERNTSLSLNVMETQLRMGDTQTGRWWQVDPKPNYIESVFVMMGNNPMRYADPKGDTLRFSFRTGFLGLFGKKAHVNYIDGNLKNRDGSLYTGKTTSFVRNTVRNLNVLANNDVSKDLLNSLSIDKRTINIKSGSKDEFNPIPNKDKTFSLTLTGKGPSSVFNVNNNNTSIPSSITLGHELYHAFDRFKNSYVNFHPSTGFWFTSQITGKPIVTSEIGATHFENRLRGSMGLPLRGVYEEGNSNSQILTSGNHSLFYKLPVMFDNPGTGFTEDALIHYNYYNDFRSEGQREP